MSLLAHIRLMADYNRWMNDNVYEHASTLDDDTLQRDQGAYFGSILGTLNHIAVGDVIWLKRFARHPAGFTSLEPVRGLPDPVSLEQVLHRDLAALRTDRVALDEVIVRWCEELDETLLATDLDYDNMRGKRSVRNLGHLVGHLFNHQTHHRGQVSTLLNQQGVDIGVTDLLMRIPDRLVSGAGPA